MIQSLQNKLHKLFVQTCLFSNYREFFKSAERSADLSLIYFDKLGLMNLFKSNWGNFWGNFLKSGPDQIMTSSPKMVRPGFSDHRTGLTDRNKYGTLVQASMLTDENAEFLKIHIYLNT